MIRQGYLIEQQCQKIHCFFIDKRIPGGARTGDVERFAALADEKSACVRGGFGYFGGGEVDVHAGPAVALGEPSCEQGTAGERAVREDQRRVGAENVQFGPGRIFVGLRLGQIRVAFGDRTVLGQAAARDEAAGRDATRECEIEGGAVGPGLAARDDPVDGLRSVFDGLSGRERGSGFRLRRRFDPLFRRFLAGGGDDDLLLLAPDGIHDLACRAEPDAGREDARDPLRK